MDIVRAFTDESTNRGVSINIQGTWDHPLFQANQIGTLLGLTNVHESIKDFSIREKESIIAATHGGPQTVVFLKERGLFRLLLASRKPIARPFQEWVYDVLTEIRLTGKYETEQRLDEAVKALEAKNKEAETAKLLLVDTQQRLEATEQEAIQAKQDVGRLMSALTVQEESTILYVFCTDITNPDASRKFGITNTMGRFNPYKQVCGGRGALEYHVRIPRVHGRRTEAFLGEVLRLGGFRDKGEVYNIPAELARCYLVWLKTGFDMGAITDQAEQIRKFGHVISETEYVLRGVPTAHSSRHMFDMATQTDATDALDPSAEVDETGGSGTIIASDHDVAPPSSSAGPSASTVKTEGFRFDEFLRECCVLDDPEAETSSKDLQGAYRLWARSATKKAFHALLDMLKTRFCPIRLKVQRSDAESVINGFRGVALIPREDVPLPLAPTDIECFLHQMCRRSVSGKVLFSVLRGEFSSWRRRVHGAVDDDDVNRLITHIRCDAGVLPAVIEDFELGYGQGVYGLSMKDAVDPHRKPSTTAKPVVKVDVASGKVVDTWPSVAKAAIAERFAGAAKMSQSIRHRVKFGVGASAYRYEFPEGTRGASE